MDTQVRDREREVLAQMQEDWFRQLKGAQEYLGLSPLLLPGLYTTLLAAPCPFKMDAVIICVALETLPQKPDIIAEIGLSMLDTRNIRDIAPGEDGRDWTQKIQSRHIKILMQSSRWEIYDAATSSIFEFGQSEWLSFSGASKVLATFFDLIEPAVAVGGNKTAGARNKLLLGHNLRKIIPALKNVGVDPEKNPNIVEALDTGAMFRAFRRELHSRSLNDALSNLGIPGPAEANNAGNNARYTLELMITLAVRRATMSEADHEAIRAEQLAARLHLAEARVRDDYALWCVSERRAEAAATRSKTVVDDATSVKNVNAAISSLTIIDDTKKPALAKGQGQENEARGGQPHGDSSAPKPKRRREGKGAAIRHRENYAAKRAARRLAAFSGQSPPLPPFGNDGAAEAMRRASIPTSGHAVGPLSQKTLRLLLEAATY